MEADYNPHVPLRRKVTEPEGNKSESFVRNPRKRAKKAFTPRYEKRMLVDNLRESTRRGFDNIHARKKNQQFSFLDKEFQVNQRLEEFNFNKEVLSRKKPLPKKFKDDHTCEKIVSSRKIRVSLNKRSESLPVLQALSARQPLPPEGKTYPHRQNVFYWG